MSLNKGTLDKIAFWEHQPFFAWSQASAILNQWYTVLELIGKKGVRIYILTGNISVADTWEFRITADGKVLTCTPVSTTSVYLASLDYVSYDIILNTFSPATDLMHKGSFLLEAKNIKIEM